MKSVHQEIRYQCTKCPKHYSKKKNLKAHRNVSHDDIKRYQCYFCSLATLTESDLIKHMSKHTNEKPYKCQYCCQWYKNELSIKRHKYGKFCNLKITYPSLSPCYFCGKVFSKHQCLNVHMKMVHLKEDFKRCNLCDKNFCSNTAINRHIRTVHLFERKYKCQLCSKRLGSYSDLYHHIQSAHTKEKPFKCYFCSKSFVKHEVLKIHILIHTREKPLTCYFCRKDFLYPEFLSVHIGRNHTKERPFKCMQCPSHYFSSKDTLNRHHRINHSNQ
jgi:KRAB domain-containing zinc finger protein